MNLMEIYDFMKFIGDKDFNGNFLKPEDYKRAVVAANIDLFKKVTGLPEEYQPGAPFAREGFEINQKALDEIRYFKGHIFDQAVASGYFTIPDDYVYFDSMTYKYQRDIDGTPTSLPRPVELLKESQLADRRGNWTKRPTTKYPVAVIRVQDTTYARFYIYPDTINAVDLHYYRFPVEPVFAWTVVSDEVQYDEGSSTEFEWGVEKHMDLVRIMLSYIGINLREEALVQYAEMQKARGI